MMVYGYQFIVMLVQYFCLNQFTPIKYEAKLCVLVFFLILLS